MSNASTVDRRPSLLDLALSLLDIFDRTEKAPDLAEVVSKIDSVLKQYTDPATRAVAYNVARIGTIISIALGMLLDRTPYETLKTILAMISVTRHYLETHYAKKLRRHRQQLEEIVQKLREVEDKLTRITIEVYRAEH